jgi:hypothetical protein
MGLGLTPGPALEEIVIQNFTSGPLLTSAAKGNLEEKHKLVKILGWNLLLDRGKLAWNYREPFNHLVKPALKSRGVEKESELRSIWLTLLDEFLHLKIDFIIDNALVRNLLFPKPTLSY